MPKPPLLTDSATRRLRAAAQAALTAHATQHGHHVIAKALRRHDTHAAAYVMAYYLTEHITLHCPDTHRLPDGAPRIAKILPPLSVEHLRKTGNALEPANPLTAEHTQEDLLELQHVSLAWVQ